ncbi:hypothetical protein [Streptomyces sp. BH104]|uniref:hypothetical protein n=1 Tax=Streptomyces sp. BH104 TaxID=3410407 RepID=UPI003BB5E474
MSAHLLLGLAVLAAGSGTVAAAVRAWPPTHGRPRYDGPPPVGFETSPRQAYCPAEGQDTPHNFDAGGVRHCRVCNTTTKDSHD